MGFQPRPAEKSVFARDGELRATETQGGAEDCGVSGSAEAGKKFPDSLGHGGVVRGVSADQIFRLIFEVVEIRIGRERSYRHDELPFVCPGPHIEGTKSVRVTLCFVRVDFCPFRGPDAPHCATTRVAWGRIVRKWALPAGQTSR